MANPLVNHEDINGFEGVEVSGLNGAFLRSLMEELQDQVELEESDEERLNCVIQSLEAEINCGTTSSSDDEQDHSCMESDDDHRDQDDYYCSISFDDRDDMNEWVSMELAEAPTSPAHELNYYTYHFGEEMISTDHNHSAHHHSYYGVSLDHSEYNSLWQETFYDAVM